jgi:putative CocE/NonD family hydrolase
MGAPEPLVEPGWVVAADGTPLAVTVYRPAGGEPQPCLVEALPYRQDDVTASYAATYRRLVEEFGYAVCRVDVRGTGSSGGIAGDEYPAVERDDLAAVFRWLAAQPWCTGRIGMFGTSYSGFNSLQLAADAPPELGAVCAIYATDDRYTDDVHYSGGVLRAIDLVDYCTYMVPMNALPPVPARWATRPGATVPEVAAPGRPPGPADARGAWAAEWRRRIDETPAWVIEWLTHQTDGATWRRGSLRLGPGGAGYERVTVPTMIVAGWADGYRNNTFRTVEQLGANTVPWRLLAGPWSHQDPARARPGPHLDLDVEMVRWFDEHLRGRPPAVALAPLQVFVRHSTRPAPDLAEHAGAWHALDPATRRARTYRRAGAGRDAGAGGDAGGDRVGAGAGADVGGALDELVVEPDIGTMAWISCAGTLPWGQPLDQRVDDARSLTYDWPADEPIRIIGNPTLRVRLRASAPVATLVAKVCDVFPDGTSALITRGTLNLTHRGVWPADPTGESGAVPQPLVPGAWYDVTVELEAIAHEVAAGHRLRLALAGADWPNVWPAPGPVVLAVERPSIELALPDLADAADAVLPPFAAGAGVAETDDDVEWRIERDVLRRTVRAVTRYGGRYEGADGAPVRDSYLGDAGVHIDDPSRAWAIGTSTFEIDWPEATCATAATVAVRSDADTYHVTIELNATLDGVPFATRSWSEAIPRHLQ